jgi:hypothetical protein
VIEIKSSYFYEKNKEIIKIKENAVLANGFKYIMILDKNYEKFLSLIQNCND